MASVQVEREEEHDILAEDPEAEQIFDESAATALASREIQENSTSDSTVRAGNARQSMLSSGQSEAMRSPLHSSVKEAVAVVGGAVEGAHSPSPWLASPSAATTTLHSTTDESSLAQLRAGADIDTQRYLAYNAKDVRKDAHPLLVPILCLFLKQFARASH